MGKTNLLKVIKNYMQTIKDSPELFSDGIDIELYDLLKQITMYIENDSTPLYEDD